MGDPKQAKLEAQDTSQVRGSGHRGQDHFIHTADDHAAQMSLKCLTNVCLTSCFLTVMAEWIRQPGKKQRCTMSEHSTELAKATGQGNC